MLKPDITASASYNAAEKLLAEAMAVGSGEVYDLTDIALSPDGRTVAASGFLMDRLEGLPHQRICLVDFETGDLRQVTQGTYRDRLPRWSPTGDRIAFLSDARKAYDFQVRLLTVATGEIVDIPLAGRWVEALHWSQDGSRLLLLTAGYGADLAGIQGATSTLVEVQEERPSWAPAIDLGVTEAQWRTAWIHDLASGDSRQVSPAGLNCWEVCWCGPARVACIASDGPGEKDWYSADVRVIDIDSGETTTLYAPADQLAGLSASPSGESIAVIEAICSDRGLVAGNLLVGGRGGFTPCDTGSVDVTFTAWQSEDSLLFAGMRGFESVLGVFDKGSGKPHEVWASADKTFGNMAFPDASPGKAPGTAVFIAEGFLSAPELIVILEGGEEQSVPFGRPLSLERFCPAVTVEKIEWSAPDALEIQGYLMRPASDGPHPVVMTVHGGPVWRSRPRYIGRGAQTVLLLQRGYAIFVPNPRGSSGQGQDFARRVFGDTGGGDAMDLLSGLDALVARGIADPTRLGVTGGSYGGYMTAWLVTQDQRFAAAVSAAPVSNWISGKFTSNVPSFFDMITGVETPAAGNPYFTRSPVMFAEGAKTPTLTICGALDRITPPSQAQEFHQALRLAGADSVLLTYPGEGHGVRNFPAAIDYSARIVDWFDRYMAAN